MNDTDEPEDRLGMTEEQWAKFQIYTHGYGAQDENGIDLSLLRRNLRLTSTERWRNHQGALQSISEIRRAGEALRLHQRSGRS